MQLRRMADDFEEHKREPSCSCGISMKQRRKAAERRAKAAAAPSIVGISKQPGGGGRGLGEGGVGKGEREGGGMGGRGSVMPKRLKSGFGHLRIDSCGPCNGRHKIARDRPGFFAMLRYHPGAIDDGRDTLC